MPASQPQALLTAMMDPGFYPHRVDGIVRRETHISNVFLTGRYVYKVKKPVNLGFLDFTRLDQRTRCCREEIRLNRRLSSGIYLDALPVTRQTDGYRLGGTGEIVETVVRMRQLSDADAMLPRLAQSRLTDADILQLVDRLVDFYNHSPSVRPPQAAGPAAWEENLQRTEPFAGSVIDPLPFASVSAAARAFYDQQQHLFKRRIASGRIRDGHGDLRGDHIYFTSGGIQIIDCIEFNDDLRILDPISDLAFLSMDLEYSGFPAAAQLVMRGYITRSDDTEALPLLDFYRCYRAMVRCKVSCLMLRETRLPATRRQRLQAAADAYLTLAHAYAGRFSRPTLWIVCGLPAAGKSTLAGALADIYGIRVIRSDVIRKQLLAGQEEPSPGPVFEAGLYSPAATEIIYRHLFDLAGEVLKQGQSVIIDATFSRDRYRREGLRLAKRCSARIVFVECRAADARLAERLRRRETEPSISDARLIHLERFKRRYAPITDITPAIRITADTDAPVDECLRRTLLSDALWSG